MKEYIPDVEWMREYLPESGTVDRLKHNVRKAFRSVHLPEKVVTVFDLISAQCALKIENKGVYYGCWKLIWKLKGKKRSIQKQN